MPLNSHVVTDQENTGERKAPGLLNISGGFDGDTLVLGESQKTTAVRTYGNILVLSFTYIFAFAKSMYNSFHKNATLKYLIVCLCMCIITEKLSWFDGVLGRKQNASVWGVADCP